MAQSDATTADEGMQAYFDDSGFGVSGEDQLEKGETSWSAPMLLTPAKAAQTAPVPSDPLA
jgi:hypothetical protein